LTTSNYRNSHKKISRFLKREYGFSREGVLAQATLPHVAAVKAQASLAFARLTAALITLRVFEPAHARHSKSKPFLCC
jgi:hypothetical protein